MSGGGFIHAAKLSRVDPNRPTASACAAAAGAVSPTHSVPPASNGGRREPSRVGPNQPTVARTAAAGPVLPAHTAPARDWPTAARTAVAGAALPTHTGPARDVSEDEEEAARTARRPCTLVVCAIGFCLIFGFLIILGSWMKPVVSIDAVAVSAADLDAAAGGAAISPAFHVAVRLKGRWLHFMPAFYVNGTVAVSSAGGAVTAAGRLPDALLPAYWTAVVQGTASAPHAALPADARERLRGELQRGEVQLDVSVVYRHDTLSFAQWQMGFHALCTATLSRQGSSTASSTCTIVKH